jgi:hypothetical protein
MVQRGLWHRCEMCVCPGGGGEESPRPSQHFPPSTEFVGPLETQLDVPILLGRYERRILIEAVLVETLELGGEKPLCPFGRLELGALKDTNKLVFTP